MTRKANPLKTSTVAEYMAPAAADPTIVQRFSQKAMPANKAPK